jgi:sporulation and spore germination protein
MTSRRRRTALLLAAVTTLTVASCGVPQDGDAKPLPRSAVPYQLLSPKPTDPATPSIEGVVTTPRVFFLDPQQRLVGVLLPLVPRGVERVEQQLLTRLSAGPTEEQRSRGLASALGPGIHLELVDITDRVARVAVSLASQDPAADRLPLAVGQVVLTATSVDGVDRVQFVHDGQVLQVPLPGGARTSSPLGPKDYQPLRADDSASTLKAPAGPATATPTPSSRMP